MLQGENHSKLLEILKNRVNNFHGGLYLYLSKARNEKRINAEAEDLFKKCKIEEYNSKMKEKEAYKLYFDEAYKYTNFYEEGDE